MHHEIMGIGLYRFVLPSTRGGRGSRDNLRSRVKDRKLTHGSVLVNPVTNEAALQHAVPPSVGP